MVNRPLTLSTLVFPSFLFALSTITLPESHAQNSVDLYGDSLPEKAEKRFGTTRLRFKQLGRGVSFSQDGKQIYAADWGEEVAVWDLESGALIRRVNPGENVDASVFLDDPNKLLVNRFTGVSIHELPSGKLLHEIPSEQDNYRDMKLSPDGCLLASLPQAGSFKLWDTDSGDQLLDLRTADVRNRGYEKFAFAPDSQRVAFAQRSGEVQIWDLTRGEVVLELKSQAGPVRWSSLHFLSDDRLLAGATSSRRDENGKFLQTTVMELWNLKSPDGSQVWQDEGRELQGEPIIVVARDRSIVASVHYDQVIVWDAGSGKVLQRIEVGDEIGRYVDLSPDNRLFASSGRDAKILIWDLHTGNEIHPQENSHRASVLDLAELPDGKRLVSVDEEGTTRIWNRHTSEHQSVLHRNGGWTRSIAAFPDGKHVVVGTEYYDRDAVDSSFKGRVALVRVSDGKLIREWLQADRVTQVAVDEKGEHFAFSTGIQFLGFGGENPVPAKVEVWRLQGDESDPNASPEDLNREWQLAYELGDAPRDLKDLKFADGGLLLTGESSLAHWKFGDEKVGSLFEPEKRSARVRALEFSPKHDSVFEVRSEYSRQDRQSTVTISRIERKPAKQTWQQELVGETVSPIQLSENGDLLAMQLRSSKRLRLLDAATGKTLASIKLDGPSIRTLRFEHGDRFLYAGMNQGDIVRWDLSKVLPAGDTP